MTARRFCNDIGAVALASGLGFGLVCPTATFGQDAPAPVATPPADFKARQFVDTAGCVFLRATVSGKRLWLALIGADDKPVCGQTPTDGAKAVASDAANAGDLAKVIVPATAADTTKATVPAVAAALVNATADTAAPAKAIAPPPTIAPVTAPGTGPSTAPTTAPSTASSTAPNTAANMVPSTVTLTAGQRWIQIGAFADQANAQTLHRRLIADGWSVGQAPIMGGKMTVVLVGPFAKPDALRAALVRLRAMGFVTAFAR